MNKLETLVWLLPASRFKNWLLTMFGHEIGASVRIAPVLAVRIDHAVIDDGATIGPLNIFRNLRLLSMGAGASIGSFNTVSTAPEFQTVNDDVGTLIMCDGAIITNRHNVDCSGVVRMGEMSALGGQRTTVLSHEVDVSADVQTAGLVLIGERSLVSTNCLLLKGSVLPDYSLLIAKSSLTRSRKPDPQPGIYGGSPARFLHSNPLEGGSWFERSETATTRLRVDLPRGLKMYYTGRTVDVVISRAPASTHVQRLSAAPSVAEPMNTTP